MSFKNIVLLSLITFLIIIIFATGCKAKKIIEARQITIHLKKKVEPQKLLSEFAIYNLQLKGFASRKENKWTYFFQFKGNDENFLSHIISSSNVIDAFILDSTNSKVKSSQSSGKGSIKINN